MLFGAWDRGGKLESVAVSMLCVLPRELECPGDLGHLWGLTPRVLRVGWRWEMEGRQCRKPSG